jgi:hypothetical protein
MSTLTVQNLRGVSPSNRITVPSGHKFYAPGGIVQVVQTVKTDTWVSTTASTWQDITGLTCSITPTSASSKVFVLVHVNGGSGHPGVVAARVRLLRGDTPIYIGDASGSRTLGFGQASGGDAAFLGVNVGTFIDSPATTSTITYKIQSHGENTGARYVNRTTRDTDGNDCRMASSITLWEIGV